MKTTKTAKTTRVTGLSLVAGLVKCEIFRGFVRAARPAAPAAHPMRDRHDRDPNPNPSYAWPSRLDLQRQVDRRGRLIQGMSALARVGGMPGNGTERIVRGDKSPRSVFRTSVACT